MFSKLSNIKTRIITGLSLFALLLAALYLFKGVLVIAIMIVGVVSFFELMLLHRGRKLQSYIILVLIGFILITFKDVESMPFSATLTEKSFETFNVLNAKAIILFTLFMAIIPIFYDKISYKQTTSNTTSLLLLSISIRSTLWWLYMGANHGNGYEIVLLLTSVVFVSDTGAYLFGSMFGKNKINKNISPKKTWEGFLGGLFSAFVMTLVWVKFFWVSFLGEKTLLIILFATPIVVVSAVVGDLYYSLIKRSYDVKDFSKVIPGHGGVLDRIDSLLFASIILYLLVEIII